MAFVNRCRAAEVIQVLIYQLARGRVDSTENRNTVDYSKDEEDFTLLTRY